MKLKKLCSAMLACVIALTSAGTITMPAYAEDNTEAFAAVPVEDIAFDEGTAEADDMEFVYEEAPDTFSEFPYDELMYEEVYTEAPFDNEMDDVIIETAPDESHLINCTEPVYGEHYTDEGADIPAVPTELDTLQQRVAFLGNSSYDYKVRYKLSTDADYKDTSVSWGRNNHRYFTLPEGEYGTYFIQVGYRSNRDYNSDYTYTSDFTYVYSEPVLGTWEANIVAEPDDRYVYFTLPTTMTTDDRGYLDLYAETPTGTEHLIYECYVNGSYTESYLCIAEKLGDLSSGKPDLDGTLKIKAVLRKYDEISYSYYPFAKTSDYTEYSFSNPDRVTWDPKYTYNSETGILDFTSYPFDRTGLPTYYDSGRIKLFVNGKIVGQVDIENDDDYSYELGFNLPMIAVSGGYTDDVVFTLQAYRYDANIYSYIRTATSSVSYTFDYDGTDTSSLVSAPQVDTVLADRFIAASFDKVDNAVGYIVEFFEASSIYDSYDVVETRYLLPDDTVEAYDLTNESGYIYYGTIVRAVDKYGDASAATVSSRFYLDHELPEWDPGYMYNADTGVLNFMSYPFADVAPEFSTSGYTKYDGSRLGAYGRYGIEYYESDGYEYYISINDYSNNIEDSTLRNSSASDVRFNVPLLLAANFWDDDDVDVAGVKVYPRNSMQYSYSTGDEIATPSTSFEFSYDGCDEVDTIAPPEVVYNNDSNIYFNGSVGAVGYIYETSTDGENYYNVRIIDDSADVYNSQRRCINSSSDYVRIAAIDKNGDRSAFTVVERGSKDSWKSGISADANGNISFTAYSDASGHYLTLGTSTIMNVTGDTTTFSNHDVLLTLAARSENGYECSGDLSITAYDRHYYEHYNYASVNVAKSSDKIPYTFKGGKEVNTISAPVLKNDKGIVSWNAVDGAIGYICARQSWQTGGNIYYNTLKTNTPNYSHSGYEYTWYVAAVDANGNRSKISTIVAEIDDVTVDTWKASPVYDAATDTLTWDNYDGIVIPDKNTSLGSYYLFPKGVDTRVWRSQIMYLDYAYCRNGALEPVDSLIKQNLAVEHLSGTPYICDDLDAIIGYSSSDDMTYASSTDSFKLTYDGCKVDESLPVPEVTSSYTNINGNLGWVGAKWNACTDPDVVGYIMMIKDIYGTTYVYDPQVTASSLIRTYGQYYVDTDFEVSVCSVDTNGHRSKFSDAVAGTLVIAESNVPANVKAAAGNACVTLTWNAVDGASKYGVYSYSSTDGYKYIGATSKTAYVVSGLTNGTKYGFAVMSYTESWSDLSAVVYATPVAPTIAKPVITSVTAGDGQVALVWNAVEGAAKYAIYTYTSADGYKLIGYTSKTAYVVSGLTNGTTYGFLVRANGTNGAWSDYTKADLKYATPVAPTVDKPVVTSVTPGDGQVAIVWGAVDGAVKYAIFTYTSADGYKLIGYTSKTAYVVSGLTNGTAYGFLVRAIGASGVMSEFTKADLKYATPVSATVVDLPEITTITPGDGQMTLIWSAPEGAIKYAVYTYTKADGYKLIGTTSKNAYIVTGLTNGTSYGFLVRACGSNGKWSEYTKADNVYAVPTSPVTVGKPEITTITPGDGKMTLIWSKPEGAIKYAVYTYTRADGYKLIGTTSKNAYIVSGLTNGTSYGFLVRACGSNNQWSEYTKADNVYATPNS